MQSVKNLSKNVLECANDRFGDTDVKIDKYSKGKNGLYSRFCNKIVCKGFSFSKTTNDVKACNRGVECDCCKENEHKCEKSQMYCEAHLYFNDFNKNDINNIDNMKRLLNLKYFVCSRCGCFSEISNNYKTRCKKCSEGSKNSMREKRSNAKKMGKICICTLQNDEKCNMNVASEEDIMKVFQENDINNYSFRANLIRDNKFCLRHVKTHLDEMSVKQGAYSVKEYEKFIQCLGCKNYRDPRYYKGNCKLCNKCSEYRTTVRNDPNQKIVIEDKKCDEKKLKIKKCKSCPTILDDSYKELRCRKCLDIENESDRIKREHMKKISEEIKQQSGGTEKICTKCKYKKNISEHFIGDRGETAQCKDCRNFHNEKNINRIRGGGHNWNVNPNSIIKKISYYLQKDDWKGKKSGLLKEIQKKMVGTSEENIKKLFEDENEISDEIKNLFAMNTISKYREYRNSAKKRNLCFKLTEEECEKLFKSSCHYCGSISNNNSLIGIDRVDNDRGYISENCVPCCYICNLMKSDQNVDIFIKKIIHILNYIKLIDTNELYDECFSSHSSCSYRYYKYRAKKKGLEFNIDQYFDSMVLLPCYLCGKKTDENNLNGIDRIDCAKGYSKFNILPCCYNCNKLKLNFTITDIIEKLYKIYQNLQMKKSVSKSEEETIKSFVDEYIKQLNSVIYKLLDDDSSSSDDSSDEDNANVKQKINTNVKQKNDIKKIYNDNARTKAKTIYNENQCKIDRLNKAIQYYKKIYTTKNDDKNILLKINQLITEHNDIIDTIALSFPNNKFKKKETI